MSLGIGSATGRTFMSLRRHYNYRLYFFGQVVSISGTWMQTVAQAWFVVQNTHSPLAVGILAVCQFGPYGLFGLFGGAVADRIDQRKVLMGTQAAFMVTAALLAGLTLTGHATVWEVYVLAGITGLITVLDNPVRQAFTIQMVGRDELPNAIALNSSLFNASRIVGPAIAGGLIAVAGVGICFLINALSYLAVLAALWLMRVNDLFPVRKDHADQNLLRGSLEGLKFAWRRPVIRSVLMMMLVIATISINFNVLLPVLASRTLNSGPEIFGILSALFGFGALVGALFSASLGRASRHTMLIGAALFSASEIGLGTPPCRVGGGDRAGGDRHRLHALLLAGKRLPAARGHRSDARPRARDLRLRLLRHGSARRSARRMARAGGRHPARLSGRRARGCRGDHLRVG